MAALKCVVFLGTVREHRNGLRVAKFIVRKLEEKGFGVYLLDPEVLDLPLLKKPLHFHETPCDAPQHLRDINQKIETADAFVLISAEYNQCIAPALTNMMDHFPISSYKYVPSGIVTYSMGPYGGVRAAVQLRAFLGELGSPNCSYALSIPRVTKALTEDGNPMPEDTHMESGGTKLVNDLEWYATALKNHKEKVGKP